jgi:hypothetical protein
MDFASHTLSCECTTRPTRSPEDIRKILNSDKDLTGRLIGVIARKLWRKYHRIIDPTVDRNDCRGWAEAGLMVAVQRYVDSKLTCTEPKFIRALFGHLRASGFYRSLDLLRESKLIGRFRDGKYVSNRIRTVPNDSTKYSQAYGKFTEASQVTQHDAVFDQVDAADLVQVVSTKLSGLEKQVFDSAFLGGFRLMEIAKAMKLTPDHVRDLNERTMDRVREYLLGHDTIFMPTVAA